MPAPARAARPATYRDVLDAPPHMVAEVLAGTLHTQPRPATFRLPSARGQRPMAFPQRFGAISLGIRTRPPFPRFHPLTGSVDFRG